MQGGLFKRDALCRAGKHRTAPAQDVQNGGVSLQGVRGKAGDGHAAARGPQHRRERGLTVIALHGIIAGVVGLTARENKGVFVLPAALDAKGRLHRTGHVDVAAALHRRDEVQRAVSGQQRQGKQQPADELAGHVACQPVAAGGQCALHGQPGSALLKPQALLPVQRFIHRLGPLHQPPAAGEGHSLSGQAGDGDEKAQGAAALAAVHRRGEGHKMPQPFHHGIVCAGAHTGAQLCRCAQRGGDVLAEFQIGDMAAPFGQRGAEHCTVGHALAGRGSDGAGNFTGGSCYCYKHR